MADYIGQPQSKEQIYNQAYQDSGVAQKQQTVNGYQGQLILLSLTHKPHKLRLKDKAVVFPKLFRRSTG